jgi:hypothetical protein
MNQKYHHLQKLKRLLYSTKFFAHVCATSENIIDISNDEELLTDSEKDNKEEKEEKDKKKSKSSSAKHEMSTDSSAVKSFSKKQHQT